jgi:diacylglycerol kinase
MSPVQPYDSSLPAADRGARRRSPWRERLMEAESGIRLGIRADSTFFVHLFVGCAILAAAFVLGLNVVQWAIIVLAMTLVLTVEMFNQVLRVLWKNAGQHLPAEWQNAVRIGTAAVVLSSVGAVIAMLLVFGQRIAEMHGG